MDMLPENDGYLTSSSVAVQVSTLLPLPVREKLRARAKKAGIGMGEYLRDLIAQDLGLEDVTVAPPKKKDVVLIPEVPAPLLPPPTVLELVERGYSAQQISAMRRMPYREVLAELGRQVDRKVERTGL